MQKPYGVKSAGDKLNLSLSAIFSAECSFRNATGKNQLEIDAVLSSKQLLAAKKGQCVMMRAETNTLYLRVSSVSSCLERYRTWRIL